MTKLVEVASSEICVVYMRMCRTMNNNDIMILPETVQLKEISVEERFYVFIDNEIQ